MTACTALTRLSTVPFLDIFFVLRANQAFVEFMGALLFYDAVLRVPCSTVSSASALTLQKTLFIVTIEIEVYPWQPRMTLSLTQSRHLQYIRYYIREAKPLTVEIWMEGI
jgi:hypothetical protein